MKKLLLLALTAGVGYWLYKTYRSVQTPGEQAAGAVKTGVVRRTYNNRPPNYPQEAIGYGVRDWAEIRHPDGEVSWTEVRT